MYNISYILIRIFILLKNIIIICGHYKGIDQRIRKKYVTDEISIGDFVLTSGELPAMIMIDAIVRLKKGVLIIIRC